ncbi:hypothetical protein BDP81DRAFT_407416 [Colletotrichum phormii]|uniref:Uncharacterized protein n=1 Tax=Colletotrichum phormii TaxID=359342 RepID=A0AAI9ZPP4_9PEZI|nr:uncharacterized protein BDP81DRAFT_407416 [Colletotrichum phormii]KAK1635869.1 hypothetical protein BDP81DRAFT_407416 [Colletotrichum phormii]
MTPRTETKSNKPDDEAADVGTKRKASEASPSNHNEDDEPDTKRAKTENAKAMVEWLLSDEAFSLAFLAHPPGQGEIDWDEGQHGKDPPPKNAGKKANTINASKKEDNSDGNNEYNDDDKAPSLTYPDSTLTPFQNLVAALLLSKPISHRLGLRTPRDLDEAGFEGRRKVMWEARTQHKEKTAEEGKGEKDEGDVEKMTALREMVKGMEAEEAQKKVEKVLTDGIKGVGPTGAGIFLRRVQEEWEEVFPYADKRSLEAAGDRGKFVRMLDVLVGIQLEKKMEEALKMARGDGK